MYAECEGGMANSDVAMEENPAYQSVDVQQQLMNQQQLSPLITSNEVNEANYGVRCGIIYVHYIVWFVILITDYTIHMQQFYV